MDKISAQKRSEIMSKVRSQDSKIEVAFRKKLWEQGFRYRKNSKRYYGRPDIILPKYKTVIFIDSCFWHGCTTHCRMPKNNAEYWQNKITRNRERDDIVTMHYQKINWQVIRIWEHELESMDYDIIKEKIKTYAF